jgi:hypothetical protein
VIHVRYKRYKIEPFYPGVNVGDAAGDHLE